MKVLKQEQLCKNSNNRRKEEEEMETLTVEQLCKNINISRSKSSNYYRLARSTAYTDMMRFNNYIKVLQQIQQEARYSNKVWTNIGIYSKKAKRVVRVSIYTKLPRYRSYRQQIAINCATLESILKNQLESEDYNRIQQKRIQTTLVDDTEDTDCLYEPTLDIY